VIGRLEVRTALLIVAVWVAFGIGVDGFLTDATFTSILGRSVENGLIAAGFTVCLLSGQIDLSVGALYALAGVVFATVQSSVGIGAGIAAAIATGLVVGTVNGILIGVYRLNSFVATLGTLLLARGAAFAISDGKPVTATDLDAALWLNRTVLGPVSPRVLAFLAFVLLAHLFVTRTRFGRELMAIGGNAPAAESVGIPFSRRIIVACLASSSGAAIAGAISALSLLAGSPIVGDANLLVAIAGVFLAGAALTGGFGSVAATGLAIVALSSIATGMELLFIDKAWQGIVTGLLIVLASAPALRHTLPRLRTALRRGDPALEPPGRS
jgi:ribose transport system permease protein